MFGSKSKTAGKKRFFAAQVPALALLVVTAMTVIFIASGAKKDVFALITGGKSNIIALFESTADAYSKEMDTFMKENAVFKKIAELYSKSYTQSLRTSDFKINISDDKDAGYYAVNGSITGIPMDIEMYLSNSRFILGSSSVFYLEADPTQIGNEIYDFSEANGLDLIDEEIKGMLDLIDFSYDKLRTPAEVDTTSLPYDVQGLTDSVNKVGWALIDKAGYSMDTYTVDIGGKEEGCDLHKLSYNNKTLISWLEDDLKAELINNKDFEVLLNEAGNAYDTYEYGMGFDDTFGSLIESIDYMIESLQAEEDMTIILELYAYENVIVKADLKLADEYNDYEMSFSATGEKYRLNDISCKTVENGELMYEFNIVSDLFGVDTLTSRISSIDYSYYEPFEDVYEIKWETKLSLNNFTVTNTYGDYTDKSSFTFMSDGDSVTLRQNQGEFAFTWQLSTLDSESALPDSNDTVKLNNANLMKIMSDLEEVFEYFDSSEMIEY